MEILAEGQAIEIMQDCMNTVLGPNLQHVFRMNNDLSIAGTQIPKDKIRSDEVR